MQEEAIAMARYMVERTFPDGLEIPMTDKGAQACLSVVGTNSELGVTWVHSYVSDDHRKTFCIYDAPSPDAELDYGAAVRTRLLDIERDVVAKVADPGVVMGREVIVRAHAAPPSLKGGRNASIVVRCRHQRRLRNAGEQGLSKAL
jgi:hypothetical protein